MLEFLPHMRLMDFPLHSSLAAALAPDGDWAALDRLDAPEAALPAGQGVAFVTNHDLELEQYGGFALPADGLSLAHAYTVCRLQSRPLVWMEHRDEPVLQAALRLRAAATAAGGWRTLHAGRQLLVWRSLDERALLVFNAAQAPRHLEPGWLGAGAWRDLCSGDALPGSAVVAPRQPGLFLRD